MEIRISIDRRSGRLLLLVVAAVVLAAAPFAWAGHRFGDVAASSPHHDDVSLIADAGVTRGCNPPANDLYCPDAPVRRDQMASFLARGLGRIGVSHALLAASVEKSATESWTTVAEVQIDVAGNESSKQYVKVDAAVNVDGTSECECHFRLRLLDVSTGDSSRGGFWQTTGPSSFGTTHTAVGVFDATGGAHTYRLQIWYVTSAQGGSQSLLVNDPYLVATTYPFLSGSTEVSAAGPAPR